MKIRRLCQACGWEGAGLVVGGEGLGEMKTVISVPDICLNAVRFLLYLRVSLMPEGNAKKDSGRGRGRVGISCREVLIKRAG